MNKMLKQYIIGFEKVYYTSKITNNLVDGYKLKYTYISKKDNNKGYCVGELWIPNTDYYKEFIEYLNSIESFPAACNLYIKKSDKYDNFYLTNYRVD